MGLAEEIYKASPHILKTALLNVRAYFNVRKRYTAGYKKYLNVYKQLWKAPIHEVLDFQREQLTRLLVECHAYVPYYKDAFNKAGITKEMIEADPYHTLSCLPLLSKKERNEAVDALTNTNPKRPTTEIGFTSGTSGTPTEIYFDKETIERSFALLSRFFRAIGISDKERSVRFSGRLVVHSERKKPPFWVHNRVEDQLFMSSYHLTASNSVAYIKKLNQYKPTFIDGYPSAIYILATFINAGNQVVTFRPKAISVTAETLYDYQRIAIEKAFKCQVYNQYASSEGSPFITECVEGNLHINEDSGVFEILDLENKPSAPGTIGRLVVTSFRNLKIPLLRYDIKDSVLVPKTQQKCACGCEMPTVEKIVGREDDILWTPEKGYVGRMDTAYKGIAGLAKSQLIQKSPLLLIVNNVKDTHYTEDTEKQLRVNLQERLGNAIQITMYDVDEIPLGANGKFDAVKREFEIPKPQ